MPELPEVENVVRGLQHLRGLPLEKLKIFDKKVWFESEVSPREFEGSRLKEISRRGKYLSFRFDSGLTILQHLRMTGKMLPLASAAFPEILRNQMGTNHPKAPQARCLFEFSGKKIVFYDCRRFGTLTAVRREEEYFAKKNIAPDPLLEADRAREYFFLKLPKLHRPIKTALLDQSLVAGVGNIYADEILYLQRLHPTRLASGIKNLESLWNGLRELLLAAIALGGSSVVNYVGADGKPGRFSEKLNVYGREGEPCPSCGNSLMRIQLAGRSTYFCPLCQKKR